jgi:phosphatidylglycerol---prolipoprotein diacylglyceryl transferase
MIVHNFDPVLIDFGLFQIRWYSIAYIAGIALAWIYANKIISKIKNNQYNFQSINTEQFDNLVTYLIIGIIVGGRLGYVLFYNFQYFMTSPFEIIKIWKGGMSFHGGLFGVILATSIFAKITKDNFFKYSDIICCVAPIGIFLGRIANFINGELIGKITTLPWAVIFSVEENLGRHPSQIYEAILEGVILFFIINFLAFYKKKIFNTGHISGIFLILYSILRIISEIFREPDVHIGYIYSYFSMGVLLSLFTLIAGFFVILFNKKNEQNN